MIDILDVYQAIDDQQPWMSVSWLADQLPYAVDRKHIRSCWLRHLDKPRDWRPVFEFKPGDFIDTREVRDNPGPVTPRQALRDSEDGI